MYFFTVELALELSKTLNKELRSGLRAEWSNVQALLVITTCKKNYKYKYEVHNKGKGKKNKLESNDLTTKHLEYIPKEI